jgi:rhamnosyl/mannosyltransferase
MEPELRRLVTTLRLGDRVFFEGSVLDSELPIYYHACQVFVLPSTHKSEAFGIVLLEAMACGKPVVTTELGTGTSYVNQHGTTGLVVPPGDVASLTGAIRRLLDDPRLRERFGCAGYERVCREYCTQRMVEGVLDTYQRVLQQRGRRRV